MFFFSKLNKIFSFIILILLIYLMKSNLLFNFNLISMSNLIISISFSISLMKKLFFMFFMGISISALFYSSFYMKVTLWLPRFFLVKILFIISMIILIFSDSCYMTFMGWDGLGVSSFCLILFFFNFKSQNSGVTTILTNRLGDSLFIIMIILVILNKTSWENPKFFSLFYLFIFMILLMTKSAQYPFSSWLPLAMAAPTPISALVHSSTLVAAGIFLFISNFFILNIKINIIFIFLISIMTGLLSGMNSLVEMDMKKIIALSTLNQLSFMFLTTSLSLVILSYFHLISHAIFKSLLFLNGGVIIHFWMNSQEHRNFGISINFSWFLKFSILISLMNLMGMSFLSGFYSKDLIIENMEFYWISFFFFMFMFFFFFTFFYSMRLIKMCFLSFSKLSILILLFKEKIYYFSIMFLLILSIYFSNMFFMMMFFKSQPLNFLKIILFFLILFILFFLKNFMFKMINFIIFNSMLLLNFSLLKLNKLMKMIFKMKSEIENGMLMTFFLMIFFWFKSMMIIFNFKSPNYLYFFLFMIFILLMLFFV